MVSSKPDHYGQFNVVSLLNVPIFGMWEEGECLERPSQYWKTSGCEANCLVFIYLYI